MEKKHPENQRSDGQMPVAREVQEKIRKWKLDRVLENLHTGELTILNPPEKVKKR